MQRSRATNQDLRRAAEVFKFIWPKSDWLSYGTPNRSSVPIVALLYQANR